MRTALITSIALLLAFPAYAETPEYKLTIKDHKFVPARIEIPAGTKVKLLVKNEDPTAEEFESNDFNREKVISGGGEATLYVGPLSAGEYNFYGEFNPKTAQGTLVVK